MLILEIILTIIAWRKGWKWLSLVPMAMPIIIGFFTGVGIGLSGGSVDEIPGFMIIFDIIAVIALIIMCFKSPKSKSNETSLNV